MNELTRVGRTPLVCPWQGRTCESPLASAVRHLWGHSGPESGFTVATSQPPRHPQESNMGLVSLHMENQAQNCCWVPTAAQHLEGEHGQGFEKESRSALAPGKQLMPYTFQIGS